MGPALATGSPASGAAAAAGPRLPAGAASEHAVCATPAAGSARCFAHVVSDSSGKPLATVSYSGGYGPSDLTSAYALTPPTATVGYGPTVAIVDAYDNPDTAGDLTAYRSQFGLPLCPDSGVDCLLTKVNQTGGSTPPAGDTGWGQEIDLDLDMVSALCPNCHILLVEANSNSYADLGAAVNEAASLGAVAISNSYGGSEFSGETTYSNTYYDHPQIAVTVATGDNSYGTAFPAVSPYVTAVGGTHLTRSTTARGWSESAWSGAGSGCSTYVTTKPAGQPKIGTCTRRIVADVSAVADPNTGVAVYDSYGSSGGANWMVFGGTSVATPIIASVYALAGNTTTVNGPNLPYGHPASLNDVVGGSNGTCTTRKTLSNQALCTAVTGYDGPTGLGTPNGTGAF